MHVTALRRAQPGCAQPPARISGESAGALAGGVEVHSTAVRLLQVVADEFVLSRAFEIQPFGGALVQL